MEEPLLSAGFAGQRIVVVPRPTVAMALAAPVTRRLTVTDCGVFPRAHRHGRTRTEGIPQAVVILCLAGRGSVGLAGRTWAVGPGELVVLPPGEPHVYGAHSDDPWTIRWMHVEGEDVPDLIRAAGVSAEDPVRRVRDPAHVGQLLLDMVSALERDLSGHHLREASGAAWHLLAGLGSATQSGRGGSGDAAVGRAQDFLRRHVSDAVSVADVARHVGLSESHLAALFRREVGSSVINYLIELRMARARQLLDGTSLAVSKVAASCGYNDPYYFTRHFGRLHGMSPRAYRRLRKG